MTQGKRSLLKRVNVSGIGLIAVVVVIWQLVVDWGVIRLQYVPAPTAIAAEFWNLVVIGRLWQPIGHTLLAVLIAWVIAMVVGVLVGILLGISPTASRWSMSSVQVFRTIPAVALVPVALLVVGFSINAEILVAAYVSVWPVIITAAMALQGVHPRMLEVARTFQMSRFDTLRKMLLPSAWPQLVVAARLALTISLILVVVTEMVGNPNGLGFELISAQQALRPERMWAFLLVTGVVGMALQWLLNLAARLSMPGLASKITTEAA